MRLGLSRTLKASAPHTASILSGGGEQTGDGWTPRFFQTRSIKAAARSGRGGKKGSLEKGAAPARDVRVQRARACAEAAALRSFRSQKGSSHPRKKASAATRATLERGAPEERPQLERTGKKRLGRKQLV